MVLREMGYVEGQNLVIESRFADGKLERLPGLAQELVHLRIDALIAVSPPAVRAVKDNTTTIPIVMLRAYSDPVELGLVASYARPGGNVTGVVMARRRADDGRQATGADQGSPSP
jgi:putative ABC transport system substrate-binding protein